MKVSLKSSARMLILASLLLVVAPSYAETTDQTITVVSHVDIIPASYMKGSEDTAARLFRTESAATQKDVGLVSYVVLQTFEAPNHFTIVETWHDAKAYALHVGSPHTVQFRQGIQPFLGSPFDARVLRQFH